MVKRTDTNNKHQSKPLDGPFNGMPTPLWSNPSIGAFSFQAYLSLG
jgi:hypothetical protein